MTFKENVTLRLIKIFAVLLVLLNTRVCFHDKMNVSSIKESIRTGSVMYKQNFRKKSAIVVGLIVLVLAALAVYAMAGNVAWVDALLAVAAESTSRQYANLSANDKVSKAVSLREKGGSYNLKQAYLLSEEVAKEGNPEAEFNIGVMYYDGEGIPKNRKEAAVWFRKAAEKGHLCSQYNLANMLESGDGVE
ncbi:MAG: sel1 repeat family protein, partial [Azoarcus sp.]|nr:sel1 repeat family protein [Azoarcus sp.]